LLRKDKVKNLSCFLRNVEPILGTQTNFVSVCACAITIPLTGNFMPFISWVHQKTDIHEETYSNDSLHVVFEANLSVTEQVRKKVEDLNGKFQTDPSS
jgi:hypothetical protein